MKKDECDHMLSEGEIPDRHLVSTGYYPDIEQYTAYFCPRCGVELYEDKYGEG